MGRALAVIIWILTLGSISLFFVNQWWFPTAISSHAAALDRQFLITIIVVGISFTAAQIGLGYMVWKYRERPTNDRALYTHGSNRLEVIWTIVIRRSSTRSMTSSVTSCARKGMTSAVMSPPSPTRRSAADTQWP